MPIITKKYFDVVVPGKEARNLVDDLPPGFHMEMSMGERRFLAEAILATNPAKCLEVGVAAGGSSVLMLSALATLHPDDHGIILNSIDISDSFYRDPSKPTGYLVDDFPILKKRHKLFTGGLACDFMEQIGDGIDFVLLDTAHFLPGEVLDYLMVLPYLTENATIVFHDTKLHTIKGSTIGRHWEISNNLLISAIYGKMLIMDPDDKEPSGYWNTAYPDLPNIAAVKINQDTKKYILDVVNLLSIGWRYIPSHEQLNDILNFVANKYGESLKDFLKRIFDFQLKYTPQFFYYNFKQK